jgi:hypothetical protein
MSQMAKGVVEPLHAAAFGLPVSHQSGRDSGTLRKQYLLDVVLPAFALLFISALTVTMIVLVATTVAHGGWLEPSKYVSVDPWAGVSAGPAVLSRDDILYPDVATEQGFQPSDPSFDLQVRARADASPFTAGVAE